MAIDLANLRFHYPNQSNQLVLNIPSWSSNIGDQTFIHGPSGCGKSTLLGILSGVLSPISGQVTVLGERLDKMSGLQRDRFRAIHIGYVFQQFNLMPYLNSIDNVLLATRFSTGNNSKKLQDRIKELFNALNIAEKDWYSPSRDLSIGQQQRVAIARALINKPRLLITDEPTSSLDKANTDAFIELLMPIINDSQTTLLFVSHDLSLSSYFSKIESFGDFNKLEGTE